jgi:hypothetical protein
MTAVYKFNHALRFARTEVFDNGVRGSRRHLRAARRLSDWESANQSEENGRYVLTSSVKHHTSDVPKCVNSKL